MMIVLYKNLLRITLNCNSRSINIQSSSVIGHASAWSNKVFVNHLKPPRLLGPTGEEVLNDVDLSNKTCLITGGTSGIGSEIVRCMVAKNCDILMACRNPYAARILSKTTWRDENKVKTYMTNLTSLASVRKTSDQLLNENKKIDFVFINAAVFGIPRVLTEDGFETIFQVNYLSQLYLLFNIEKILAPNARVVFLSSESHRNINWSIDEQMTPSYDLVCLPEEEFTSIKAYNTSKLCGILAMHYLCYRWSKTSRAVFCAHPGSFIKTSLCCNWWPYEHLYTLMKPFSKSIAQAASTPLYCATSPDLEGCTDLYFKDCKECEMSPLAQDTRLAYRIMDLSQSLIMERGGYGKQLLDTKKQTPTEFEKQTENLQESPKNDIEERIRINI
ncbi:hypothetical protein O0L34_g5124 [Tuta absoluta]|nr:hypothetical protein O0L34_g5124 [Tuta absoluta]